MEEGHLERKGARELADAAMVSRSAWYRRMNADGRERPVGAHRRLQLERAAYRLVRAEDSVSDLGLGAGFANTSAFTHAFRHAYGLARATTASARRAGRGATPPRPDRRLDPAP